MGGVNSWTIKGPPGGYVQHLAASPTDSSVLYAAYTNSLFRSTDAGLTWQSVRELHTRVVAFAVDPTDGNRIYVGGTGEGLFRSDDAGNTYLRIAPPYPHLGSMAVNGNVVVYASLEFVGIGGTVSRIHRSTDRGLTWTSHVTPATFWQGLLIDSSNADTIIGISNGAAYRSADGGATWQAIMLSAATPAPQAQSGIVISSTAAMITASDGIYRTTDGGANWNRVFTSFSVGTIVADATSPDTFIASPGPFTIGGQLIRSTDQGATWNTLATLPIRMRHGAFAVRRNSSSQFVIASEDNVFVSNNSGSTWTEATIGPSTSYVTQFATTTAPNSKLYAITSGIRSALFSTAADGNWQRVDVSGILSATGGYLSGTAVVAVKPGDPNSIVFAPRVYTAFRTANGGASWAGPGVEMHGFAKHALAFDPAATSTLYAQVAIDPGVTPTFTPANGLYRSVDGGATWSPRSTNLGVNIEGAQLVVDPANPARIYLAARERIGPNSGTGGLYISSDSGVTWTQSLVAQDLQAIEVDPSNSNRVYVAAANGLLISNDGGSTFTANSAFAAISADPVSAFAIDPTTPSIIYAATLDPYARNLPTAKSSTVARSVDAGQTWEVLRGADDDPEWHVSKLALDPNVPSLLYAATEIRGVAAFEIAPDLALSITGHSGIRTLNTAAHFDLQIVNRGVNAATSVRAITRLPAGLSNLAVTTDRGGCSFAGDVLTCNAAVLRPGQSINVRVGYTPTNSAPLAIVSELNAHERDSNTGNNIANATAYAGEIVDLSVTISPDAARIRNGESVTYSVQVTNGGPTEASDAVVRFTPGRGLAAGAPPQGCAITTGVVVCNSGSLPVGASRTFALTANAEIAGATSVGVTVAPVATATDGASNNNTAAATVDISESGDLSVSIADSADPATVSTNFEYRATVRNAGPDSMSNVAVAIANTATTVNVASTQGSCSTGVSGISCNLGVLASGATATITVVSASSAEGSVSLQATVTSDGADRVTTNNSAQEFTTVRVQSSESKSGGGAFGVNALLTILALLLALQSMRLRNESFANRNTSGGPARRRTE